MKGRGIQLVDDSVEHLMDFSIEVVRDASGLITQGIRVGDTLEQNKALLLMIHPGELRMSPLVGVGLSDMVLDHDYLVFRHRIREQFAMDGLRVTKLDLNPDRPVVIEARYES